MSKAPVDIIKYVIHAEAEATGLVEKPDLIGAIFGQTEGLLGEDLDLRELQKSGRIGRIDADLDTKAGVTKAKVTIPSSLDMVETSIIAAGVETITRIGPCDAKFKISNIEDVREEKRTAVVSRARELLKTFMHDELPDAKEISEELRKDIRTEEITKVEGLDAGPAVTTAEDIIIVEGRADVLTLLRNGIKNSVAVGGIKIPKEITKIAKGKSVTAFVDGDRGGDLILKSLKNAGVTIDNVSRAPAGREVEGLARKEIVMCLRRKKSSEEAFNELDDASNKKSYSSDKNDRDGRSSDSRSRSSDRNSSRDGRSSDSRSRSSDRNSSRDGRSSDSRSKSSDRSSDSRDGRSSDTERSESARSRGGRDQNDRESREPRQRSTRRDRAQATANVESANAGESSKLLSTLTKLKGKIAVLDDKFEVVKEVEIGDLKKLKKELKDANALVIDDILTNEVLENSGGAKFVCGITTAGNLKAPKDKKIVTKF